MIDPADLKALLEDLYGRYSRREQAREDPVRFLYGFEDVNEREVAGLIAAFLSYGTIRQILRSVQDALGRLGDRPREFILSRDPKRLRQACDGFVHRTVNASRLFHLLGAVAGLLRNHSTLHACFRERDDPDAPTVLPGLRYLARELGAGSRALHHLVADPSKGSACKRWCLYLRWMVRRDAVDPGGWDMVSPARLILPLDAHVWRVCRALALTERKSLNMAAALELTDVFRRISPEDPLRYDFALMHASAAGDPRLRQYLASAPD